MKNKTKPTQKNTLIIGQENDDFDTYASLLAAQKLYKNSFILFPDSLKKSVHNPYIQLNKYLFKTIDFDDINMNKISCVIVVDTKGQPDNIKIAHILKSLKINTHICDHHRLNSENIPSEQSSMKQIGANSSILVNLLKEKNIKLTKSESTFIYTGIYERTGGFSYPSTTIEDFKASAYLLSQNAILEEATKIVSKHSNSDDIIILNDLINNSKKLKIDGIQLTLSRFTGSVDINDFKIIAFEFFKIIRAEALFITSLLSSHIHILGFSNNSNVDVYKILKHFNARGHSYQAHALIHDKTLAQTEKQLEKLVVENMTHKISAEDLMSSPAIYIEENGDCSEARSILTRYNINVLIVLDKNKKLSGYISRQVIEKALQHNFKNQPVRSFMTNEFTTVKKDTSLSEIKTIILDGKARIVPVVADNHKLLGAITRTNILNALVNQDNISYYLKKDQPLKFIEKKRNVSEILMERVKPSVLDLLKKIGIFAADLNFKAYLIGGFVRDLLLNKDNGLLDIDITIEGDGILFARKLTTELKVNAHYHDKFGSATIKFSEGFKIDITTARHEYYKKPAVLPDIEKSSLKMDLYRRDFTINTLAVNLNPNQFGLLIDYFSGQKDLYDKAIRILHNLSFIEDPTRAFRAVRFEQRFGFRVGKLTEGLINTAVKMNIFNELSGYRILNEIKHILNEDDPIPAIIRLYNLDLFVFLSNELKLNKYKIKKLYLLQKVISWQDLNFPHEKYNKWVIYLLILFQGLSKKEALNICDKLSVSNEVKKIFIHKKFNAERDLTELISITELKNSSLYKRLIKYPIEIILYLMVLTDSKKIRERISYFQSKLQLKVCYISGHDIKKRGLKPGPVYKEILDKILVAKLDGEIHSEKEEKIYLEKIIQSKKGIK